MEKQKKSIKEKLMEVAKASFKIKVEVNLGGGMGKLSDEVVDPFFQQKVEDTATPLDDGLKAYLMPEIKKGLVNLGEEADKWAKEKLAKIPFIS